MLLQLVDMQHIWHSEAVAIILSCTWLQFIAMWVTSVDGIAGNAPQGAKMKCWF